MKRASKITLLLIVGFVTSGCGGATLVTSNEKQAYVIDGNIFSTNVYHCKSDGQRAVCTEVTEVEQ